MKNSTTRILAIAVVLLLLANIALVIFMVNGRRHAAPRRAGRGEPFEMLVKDLNMTEDQQKQFKQLREDHFNSVRPLFDSVRAAKTAYFGLIREPETSDSTLSASYQKVIDLQTRLDRMTFDHFHEVRSLLTPQQQPRYDSFITRLMQRGRRDSTAKDPSHDQK